MRTRTLAFRRLATKCCRRLHCRDASPEAAHYADLHTGSAVRRSMGDWGWRADLAKVSAPVLVVHGEEELIPMSMVEEWVTALP